jgi:uncharacterized protein
MMLSNEEIKIIVDYFRKKPVMKAFLFGSFSRGDATEASDVDILVELDYTKHIGLGFISMKLELEERLQKKIDLITSNSISEHLLPFINRDKKLIYEK